VTPADLTQADVTQPGAATTGRIDVHSHLLPGVDDGSRTVEESIRCATMLVGAGYTHSFCTPHIWPGLPENRIENILRWTARLQREVDAAAVPLRLIPGGEINLTPDYHRVTPPEEVVTFAMARRHVLFDLWADRLPEHFGPAVRWFQSLGLTPILAHPERLRAVQDEPQLADLFARMGILLQGNLQCFTDTAGTPTRRLAEQFLLEGRYFLLGCDLHRIETLPARLDGLAVATKLAGEAAVRELTVTNPKKLLPQGGCVTP
jgi:protein-tyrosine phosphatase